MSEKTLPEDSVTFTSIRKFIQASFELLFEFLSFLQLVLWRNKLGILLGILTGLLLGYAYYLSRPKFYKASMIVQYNELAKKTYAEILDQLDQLIRNGSDQALASKLQVSESLASNIIFVDGRNIDDNPLNTDTSTRLKQPFKIIIGMSKPMDPVNFENSIVSYLNNSPYLKKSREEQRKINLGKLDFILSEEQKLDSLKKEYNRFLAGSKNTATFYNNEFDPAELYIHSLKLSDEKEKVLRWLNIDENAVTVIDGFKPIDSPASISLFKSLLVFSFIAFLIIFLISFLTETKKKLRHGKYIPQKQ